MAAMTASPILHSLDTEVANSKTKDKAGGMRYWWNTSGHDLSNMLHEADYPEEVQGRFLSYYRDTICLLLGARPDSTPTKSGVGWDGNPLEYSVELKGLTKSKSVRFVVDLSELRPADKANTLSMAATPGGENAGVRRQLVPRAEGVARLLPSFAERAGSLDRQGRTADIGDFGLRHLSAHHRF